MLALIRDEAIQGFGQRNWVPSVATCRHLFAICCIFFIASSIFQSPQPKMWVEIKVYACIYNYLKKKDYLLLLCVFSCTYSEFLFLFCFPINMFSGKMQEPSNKHNSGDTRSSSTESNIDSENNSRRTNATFGIDLAINALSLFLFFFFFFEFLGMAPCFISNFHTSFLLILHYLLILFCVDGFF